MGCWSEKAEHAASSSMLQEAVQVVVEEPQGRKEKLAVWLDVIKHDWMLGSHDHFPMFNHCTDL